MAQSPDDDLWFFDIATHEVTHGKTKGWQHRMGPYPTREAAEAALDIAKARNRAADDWDNEDD